jgi:UDP-glucose 4-epimerase
VKALITGGDGLLGKALTNALQSYEVISTVAKVSRQQGISPCTLNHNIKYFEYYCALDNEAWVQCLFDSYKPDIIFHMAAEQNTSHNCFQNNVQSTFNLIKHAPEGCRFVFASSSTVYGNFSIIEDLFKNQEKVKARENFSTQPTNAYGASKVACEALVNAYTSLGKIIGVSLRYCAIVSKESNRGLIPDIIKKLRSDSEILELWGKAPGSIKPFLHIDDTLHAALSLGMHSTGVYNIAPDDELSVSAVADIIMQKLTIKKEKKMAR